MGFNSFTFILAFLPILLVGWYALNSLHRYKLADIFLTMMSLYFYYSFGVSFLPVLLCTMLANYLLSALMELERIKTDAKLRRLMKIFGIVLNLLPLFYYKYLGAFAGDFNFAQNIVMPIGISFFTFGQLSFIIDRANGEAPHYPFLKYAMFTTYFPKLIQGPIAFHGEMISQFDDFSLREPDSDRFARGTISFVIGLGKKVLLADTLSKCVTYGFHYTYFLDTLTVIAVILAYAFQIYFDFSGYCDMAEGVSLMLGFELPANFNSPFKAKSSKELWQRWHITLSRFFVKYVYIPLGGSKKGQARTIINVLIIFVLSSLWHGVGMTYLCWGLIQGILVVSDNLLAKRRKMRITPNSSDVTPQSFSEKHPKLSKIFGTAFTFTMFVITLFFFGSQNMTYALQLFKRLFFWTYPGFLYRTASQLEIAENYLPRQLFSQLGMNADNAIYMITMVALLAISFFIITRKNTREIISETKFSKKTIAGTLVIFIWSLLSLSNVSTFIYFQF